MECLGKYAAVTSSEEVNMVKKALELQRRMRVIIAQSNHCKRYTSMFIFLENSLPFIGQGNSSPCVCFFLNHNMSNSGSCMICDDIGNATAERDLYFLNLIKDIPGSLFNGLSSIPIQIQISFMKMDGMKCIRRVITTEKKSQSLKRGSCCRKGSQYFNHWTQLALPS